jgi:hypothetical protein
MGQIEIYNWLLRQRKAGDDRFFSRKEIFKGLKDEGVYISSGNAWFHFCQLERFGYIEAVCSGNINSWYRKYRAVLKTFKQSSKPLGINLNRSAFMDISKMEGCLNGRFQHRNDIKP